MANLFSGMSAFLNAAFRGQLPEAGILPALILLIVFGILALGSHMISRPERGSASTRIVLVNPRLQSLD